MGKHNSSLTRVQPVFELFYHHDPSGEAWLRPLMHLARRETKPDSMMMPEDVGQLVAPPQFEFAANPPQSFLEWLIKHPQHLARPSEAEWNKWGARTRTKREALLSGDVVVQGEAITQLQSCSRLPQRAWWRLEGITRVDCALLTPSTIVFVEGKRTEMGPSEGVVWYPFRNQVLRILDCAAAFAKETRRSNFFAMLVVEKDAVEGDPKRQSEINAVTSPETVKACLPHLTDLEREESLRHYLGVTTWQDILNLFHLGSVLLDCGC